MPFVLGEARCGLLSGNWFGVLDFPSLQFAAHSDAPGMGGVRLVAAEAVFALDYCGFEFLGGLSSSAPDYFGPPARLEGVCFVPRCRCEQTEWSAPLEQHLS